MSSLPANLRYACTARKGFPGTARKGLTPGTFAPATSDAVIAAPDSLGHRRWRFDKRLTEYQLPGSGFPDSYASKPLVDRSK